MGLPVLLTGVALWACSAPIDATDADSVPAFSGGRQPGASPASGSASPGGAASNGAASNGAVPGRNAGAGQLPAGSGANGISEGVGQPALTGNGAAPSGAGTPGGGSAGSSTEALPHLVPEQAPALVRNQGERLVQDSRQLLRLSYGFYGAQRSGDGSNWLLDAGEKCHMNDGQAIGRDLTGGWYDAGDHLKVTLSIAYAAYVISKGFDAFPSVFDDRDGPRYAGTPNGVPDILDEVRYGTDYLVKAHLAQNQLVAMIGEINSDHGLPLRNGRCSSPQAQSIQRPVSMQSNADVSGISSAALALAARLYRPFDASLAQSYLGHARDIYAIAKANPRGSDPGLYGQTDPRYPLAWVDEAMCGAAELYRATGEQQYADDALAFNEMMGPHLWAPNFSQAADFCRHSLIVGLRDAGQLDSAQRVAQNEKDDIANYLAHISTEPNTVGLMHMDEWGSLRYAVGAAFGASLYYEVTGDPTARDLALSQLNYVMGKNSYDRSFVIGFGKNPPTQPHHRNQIATGKSLAGALVGGPTNGAVGPSAPGYADDAEDYLGNEVALDYNAGLVGLAAFGSVESGN